MIISTFKESPQFIDEILLINSKSWPEFMLNWECRGWSQLFTTYSDNQIVIVDEERVAAFGHTIPLFWDKEIVYIPDDLKKLIDMAMESRNIGQEPNVMLALAVVVSHENKQNGLSSMVLKAMKEIAGKSTIKTMIVPVRPTLKTKYPLISIKDYSKWLREDGMPFDPWLRVHKRLGGEIFKTADTSIVIKGSIGQWKKWTGMEFPCSGKYIVDGALNPVEINVENDIGFYTDPCIWVSYEI